MKIFEKGLGDVVLLVFHHLSLLQQWIIALKL